MARLLPRPGEQEASASGNANSRPNWLSLRIMHDVFNPHTIKPASRLALNLSAVPFSQFSQSSAATHLPTTTSTVVIKKRQTLAHQIAI
jgi:hypothetical protein